MNIVWLVLSANRHKLYNANIIYLLVQQEVITYSLWEVYKFLFWNQKNTLKVLRIYQYCEKILGTLASKLFFLVWQRCQVGYPIGTVYDFQII